MNTNEHDYDELPRDDHALLTAALFGELSEADQRALDARLAAEPELAAQRDALAATAGLVQGSFPKGESLPPELLASLERAATGPAPRSIASGSPTRTNWIRLAAGFTLLCGGAIAAKEYASRDDAPVREDRTARYEEPSEEALGRAGTESRQAYGQDLDEPEGLRDRALSKRAAEGGALSAEAPQSEAGAKFARVTEGSELSFDLPADAERSEEDAFLGVLVERSSATAEPSGGLGGGGGAQPQGDGPSSGVFLGTSPGGTYRGAGDTAPPPKEELHRKAGEEAKDSAWMAGLAETETATVDKPAGARGKSSPAPATAAGPSSPGPSGAAVTSPKRTKTKNVRIAQGVTGPQSPPAETPELAVVDELTLGYVDAGEEGRFRRAIDLDEEDLDSEFELQDRKRDYAGRRIYTDAELDELAKRRSDVVLHHCRRRPNERPGMMFFRFYGDNPFELAHLDAQSTFGADVDTASYTLARRYLRDGLLPEKAQIRTEEFVNYMKPDLAPPSADSKVPFAVHTELSASRFGTDRWARDAEGATERQMLRVGVRGKVVAREDRQPLQLTFVVDTSGSMREGNRMELVKHALRLLVTELDARDSIALVAFSNEARQVLPMTSAANRGLIETAIYGLNPDGGTNAEAGLMMGYETAGLTLAPGNHSRVVLLSDGVANIGQTDQDRVNDAVKTQRDRGIYLNTVGVGMGNHNDVFLEQLANKGDGLCNYVDDEREARRALVENFTGAFETIARDLKVQVEFDPSQVYRYRLLGYENRAIADVDFRNDKVDAGEVGAGHQVVALYELELTGNASEEPMATVHVRWKAPTGAGRDPLEDVAAGELSYPVMASSRTAWSAASPGFQRDACVAQFAEILRRSVHARGDSLDDLIAEASKLDVQLRDADFSEFVDMLRKSRELIIRHAPRHTDLTDCIDALRRNRILRAQLEEVRRESNDALLQELESQNAQLETRIRDLIRQELEQELK